MICTKTWGCLRRHQKLHSCIFKIVIFSCVRNILLTIFFYRKIARDVFIVFSTIFKKCIWNSTKNNLLHLGPYLHIFLHLHQNYDFYIKIALLPYTEPHTQTTVESNTASGNLTLYHSSLSFIDISAFNAKAAS